MFISPVQLPMTWKWAAHADGSLWTAGVTRLDLHPYEEAQGFQRLLDLPGYDVTALVEKSGKSASHIYARLSLLQLIPAVAEAFVQEHVTASHANLIARLPQEHQAEAFENSWSKDWQDKEAHLLPAKHLSAWVQANLYLNLAQAPFDREDITLKPEAGACVTCPRRSGFNTGLFADVQGDQCLDAPCFQAKVTAHIDRELAARPELVTIETAWRAPKEQRPGALQRHQYRELDAPDKLCREVVRAMPQTHALQDVMGGRRHFFSVKHLMKPQRHANVLQRRQAAMQIVLLKNESHLTPNFNLLLGTRTQKLRPKNAHIAFLHGS